MWIGGVKSEPQDGTGSEISAEPPTGRPDLDLLSPHLNRLFGLDDAANRTK